MPQNISLNLSPEIAADEALLLSAIARHMGVAQNRITGCHILKKSIDARSRHKAPEVLLQLSVFIDEVPTPQIPFDPELQYVRNKTEVLIVGAGPAGLFAALKLITLGYKPVVLERGKDVRSRRRDLAAMNKQGIVNPDSNYCFGEGGTGTYSDGKLYTRSTKRGNVQRILDLFVYYGAPENILYDAHPHIGTNKLPHIISAMSEAIREAGGEIHFDTRVTELLVADNAITGLTCANGLSFKSKAVILATGHSARDIFEILYWQGLTIEAKPFALGVRIEHPQSLVDGIQYHCETRSPYLPPASYSLVSQQLGRGVFSFCMCPGGIIAPASTAPGEIVVNGWSPSKRNNPFANSGTVVAVNELDYKKSGFEGPLAGMYYQQKVEQDSFAAGGGDLVAPAQRMADFVSGKISTSLPDCSYLPGISSVLLREVLPSEVHDSLRLALKDFGKKMKGYFTNEALLVATESRTSSPVRIPRDKETLQHPEVAGLYPCAEGAGYAGGIVSAAIDGERCAEAAVKLFAHNM